MTSLAILAVACGLNCTVVPMTPPPALAVCEARNEALAAINADLVKRLQVRAKTRSIRPRPCKKGRTRNSRGICGRW